MRKLVADIKNNPAQKASLPLQFAPKVTSVEELNTMLLKRCIKDGDRVVDGQQEQIAEAFSREKVYLLALPER